MGRYFYPADMNNRKLPIYLANLPADYSSLVQNLMEGRGSGNGSAGIFVVCKLNPSDLHQQWVAT